MNVKKTDWRPEHWDLITDDLICIGCDKILYITESDAIQKADILTFKWKPLWVYRCRYGLGWHLTSRPPSDKYPERTGIKETKKKREMRNRKRLRQKLENASGQG